MNMEEDDENFEENSNEADFEPRQQSTYKSTWLAFDSSAVPITFPPVFNYHNVNHLEDKVEEQKYAADKVQTKKNLPADPSPESLQKKQTAKVIPLVSKESRRYKEDVDEDEVMKPSVNYAHNNLGEKPRENAYVRNMTTIEKLGEPLCFQSVLE